MQADLLTWLLKLVLSVFLLITSLVPGNPVGTGEKESWVQSALQSVRGCQGSGMEVMWPHSTCTRCCYIGSWRHECFWKAFLSLPKRVLTVIADPSSPEMWLWGCIPFFIRG